MIKYYIDPALKERLTDIAVRLGVNHDFSRVVCIRSRDSAARRILARCHALPRIMQTALCIKPHYIIEIISEQFDNLSEEEQVKTLIHEVMHIPKAFGGGFRHHDFVCRKNVDVLYKKLMKAN